MTTESRRSVPARRRPRRRGAPASRILATGVSAATLIGLTAAWTAQGDADAAAGRAVVRVLVTDSRIDVADAVGAALRAADLGQDRALVPIDGEAPDDERGVAATPDVTTRAS